MLKNYQKKSNKMSSQPKRFSALFRFLCLLGILFFFGDASAYSSDNWIFHDTDGTQPSAPVAVVPGVTPYFDIYSYWDTLNLDPYKIDFKELQGNFYLPVLNEDCGFALPVLGTVSSGFGWRWGHAHQGVDINLKHGDTVMAAFDGVVRMSRWYYGYGNCVVVRHHNGLETLYGHLSKLSVKPGDLVNAGQTLGLGGSTGHSTGPHLHFETRFMGRAFNPEQLIDFKKDSLLKDTLTFTAASFVAPAAPVYRSYYRNNYRKSTVYRRRR
jgi:murein DD-endopeptidase MepM/ murein hydrolase activator NlpD